MALRDPSNVDAELVSLVRALSRKAGREASEIEVRAALAPLSATELKALRRLARGAPPATPLGPMAWADVARGTDPQVASARELGGYYQLLAERDALAAMVATGEVGAGDTGERLTGPADEERRQAGPRARTRARPSEERDDREPEPILPDEPARKLRGEKAQRAQQILGLYAYHRDTPTVAQALRLSLSELEAELDELKLRRKAGKLVRGTDFDLPRATPTAPPKSGPPLRRRAGEKAPKDEAATPPPAAGEPGLAARPPRPMPAGRTVRLGAPGQPPLLGKQQTAEIRGQLAPEAGVGPRREVLARDRAAAKKPARSAPPPERKEPAAAPANEPKVRSEPFPENVAAQAAHLRKVLAEVGARRKALAKRLGVKNEPLPEKVLLLRFRAAGLDRELGLRERDLIRGLFKRHHGSIAAVAGELDVPPRELMTVAQERGLSREVETLRDQFRREARAALWPRERIELLLAKRGWLSDLGVLRELEEEVRTRVRLLWDRLLAEQGTPHRATDALARELHLKGADARALAKLLKLS